MKTPPSISILNKFVRTYFLDITHDPPVSVFPPPAAEDTAAPTVFEDTPMPVWKGIVGKAFTPDEFDVYVRSLRLDKWTPKGITIHHTGVPSLKQRPTGFSPQNILNLQNYFRDEKGWSAAPHLFIDMNKIWVFTPLTVSGIHAVSFNRTHWGIEMLGNYDIESPNKEVFYNTYRATAALLRKIGKDESVVNFHRDDPLTKKTCPGTRVDRAAFRAAVDHVGSIEVKPSTVTIEVDGEVARTPSAKLVKNSVVALLSELNDSVPGIDIAGSDISVSAATFYRNRNCTVNFDNERKCLVVRTPSGKDSDPKDS